MEVKAFQFSLAQSRHPFPKDWQNLGAPSNKWQIMDAYPQDWQTFGVTSEERQNLLLTQIVLYSLLAMFIYNHNISCLKQYRFEAQNNNSHFQHLFQVLINIHGWKSTRKHPHRLVLFWFLKTDSCNSDSGWVHKYHYGQLAISRAENSG